MSKEGKLSVIAIGDPHFQVSNIPEVNMFVDILEKLCLERQPELIVILGDLLHTHERLHTMPLNLAVDFVERMSKISPTIVLVGNHDMCNNQQFLTSNHWMNALKTMDNVEVADTVLYRNKNGVKMIFCPYVPPGRFEEALNTCEKNWKKMDAIFCHQEFYGCKMGAIVSIEGDKWAEENPEIISGHIHSRQKPQENIYYCGASMMHSFGESEKNIIPVIKLRSGKTFKLEEVDLELPRKKIIYKDVENMDDYTLPENSKDKIKLTLSGNYEEFKAFKKTKKYREITKTGTKVVFKPKKIKKADLEEVKENGEEKDTNISMDETSFIKILYDLVNKEENEHLKEIYESVISTETEVRNEETE